MLKTIKTTKHLRLDELIKYCWENDIEAREFFNNNGNLMIDVNDDGKIGLDCYASKNDRFEVEIEEKITKDTKFDLLITLFEDSKVKGGYDHATYYDNSVKYILETKANKYRPVKEIHALVNGKLELIWSVKTNAKNK